MRFYFIAFFILSACTSEPITSNPGGVEALPRDEYTKLLAKNTQRSNQYSGFYQTFQADVSMLTTEVQTASLKERAQILQWDQHQYQTEREKVMQEASAYSKFFLRFFSPDREYDDLSKPKTIWKVYLDVGGSRVEGKVKKLTDKFVELQTLYPNLDRFSTPYEVTFNTPMTTVEQGRPKFILTSSLGSAEFTFPAGK